MTDTKRSGTWSGTNGGDPWHIEVEVDCMDPMEPFTVSVWVSEREWHTDPKQSVEGAFLSAEQAREVAAVLMAAADGVDFNNHRPEVQERLTQGSPDAERPFEGMDLRHDKAHE